HLRIIDLLVILTFVIILFIFLGKVLTTRVGIAGVNDLFERSRNRLLTQGLRELILRDSSSLSELSIGDLASIKQVLEIIDLKRREIACINFSTHLSPFCVGIEGWAVALVTPFDLPLTGQLTLLY